jgi:predicted PurR-regulated permease PerM
MEKKYLPALVCGFGAAVLTTIPGLESFACCLLVPIASLISVRLYKKANREIVKLNTGTGVILGLLTGLFAAGFTSIFELFLTYITKTNDLVAGYPQAEELIRDLNLGDAAKESLELLKKMISEIQTKGFSFLYSVIIIISNLLTYSIFGMLGGVIGTALLNKRNKLS